MVLGAVYAGQGDVTVEYGEGEFGGGADLTIHVDIPRVQLTGDPGGFTHATIEDFGAPDWRPGAPNLPRRILRIAIPEGASVRLLDVRVRGDRFFADRVPAPVPTPVVDVGARVERVNPTAGPDRDVDPVTGRRVTRSERLIADPRL